MRLPCRRALSAIALVLACAGATNAGASIGGNVTVRGASAVDLNPAGSSSHATETGDLRIAGNLTIRGCESATNHVRVDSVNVCGSTSIVTGSAGDVITFIHSDFVGKVTLGFRGGDDTFQAGVGDESKYDATFALDGGPGIDSASSFAGIFAVTPPFKQFETHP